MQNQDSGAQLEPQDSNRWFPIEHDCKTGYGRAENSMNRSLTSEGNKIKDTFEMKRMSTGSCQST